MYMCECLCVWLAVLAWQGVRAGFVCLPVV